MCLQIADDIRSKPDSTLKRICTLASVLVAYAMAVNALAQSLIPPPPPILGTCVGWNFSL